MCGIYGIADKNKFGANEIVDGLKQLEYRGYDSWGVAVETDTQVKIDKHVGKIGNARSTLPDSTVAIGHTRWATHGGVTDENAHPHTDCKKSLAIVHNGIVENYEDLRQTLLEKSHSFTSQTDTEVVVHLIEEYMKHDDFVTSCQKAFNELVGSNAIVVMDNVSKSIFAARLGSPLVIGKGTDKYFIASDITPFLDQTRTIYFLDEGEAVLIKNDKCIFYKTKTGKIFTPLFAQTTITKDAVSKGEFPHFFIKEIYEQVTTIPKTTKIDRKDLESVVSEIKKAKKIILLGCGTAYYCAVGSKYYFAKYGVDVSAYQASEFTPFLETIDENSLVIAISQSGETAETLETVKYSLEKGATVIGVVNARGSSLERIATMVIPVGSGPEIAVVSTKAFSAQLAVLYQIARACNGELENGRKDIEEYGKKLGAWLNERTLDSIKELAQKLIKTPHVFVIGRGVEYPFCLEFALKIKEASYIHAEGFAAGELKHGVIALIEKGTPCIVLCSHDEEYPPILSTAAELKSRGAWIIGVGPQKAKEFDTYIPTFKAGDLTGLTAVITGQLLGYYMALFQNLDPDKPRNLAKSVTVK